MKKKNCFLIQKVYEEYSLENLIKMLICSKENFHKLYYYNQPMKLLKLIMLKTWKKKNFHYD